MSINEAWEEDRVHEFIILSNIFFESLISSALMDRWETCGLDDIEIEQLDGQDYFHKLNMARRLSVIEDSTYTLLMLLNKSRNKYAHKVEAFAPDYQTPIEEQNKLEDIHNLIGSLPASTLRQDRDAA